MVEDADDQDVIGLDTVEDVLAAVMETARGRRVASIDRRHLGELAQALDRGIQARKVRISDFPAKVLRAELMMSR